MSERNRNEEPSKDVSTATASSPGRLRNLHSDLIDLYLIENDLTKPAGADDRQSQMQSWVEVHERIRYQLETAELRVVTLSEDRPLYHSPAAGVTGGCSILFGWYSGRTQTVM